MERRGAELASCPSLNQLPLCPSWPGQFVSAQASRAGGRPWRADDGQFAEVLVQYRTEATGIAIAPDDEPIVVAIEVPVGEAAPNMA